MYQNIVCLNYIIKIVFPYDLQYQNKHSLSECNVIIKNDIFLHESFPELKAILALHTCM